MTSSSTSEETATLEPPVVVVLACERRECSYVEHTAAQIDKEGGDLLPRMVVVDGDAGFAAQIEAQLVAAGCVDWQIVALGARRGSTLGMWGALKAAEPMGRDVIFFEDDVQLCRNAMTRMAAVQVPECFGLVTFFDMKEVDRGAAPGLYARPKCGDFVWQFWGCQAMRIPAEMVQWLAECNWLGTRIGPATMASDLILGKLLDWHVRRRRIGVHIPCLVQHVGAVSGCAPGATLTTQRCATNYPGLEFDADALPFFDGIIEESVATCKLERPSLPAWYKYRRGAALSRGPVEQVERSE